MIYIDRNDIIHWRRDPMVYLLEEIKRLCYTHDLDQSGRDSIETAMREADYMAVSFTMSLSSNS